MKLPLALLRGRSMALPFYVHLATGITIYAILYFIDLYFSLAANHNVHIRVGEEDDDDDNDDSHGPGPDAGLEGVM